uniref:Uncharacterized protein n=1 Tax=Arundo donax TaxID=35708 RepID=A0A0A9CD30_ARUDO
MLTFVDRGSRYIELVWLKSCDKEIHR